MHKDDVLTVLRTLADEFEAFGGADEARGDGSDGAVFLAAAKAYRRAAALVEQIDPRARRVRRRRVAVAAAATPTRGRRGRPRRAPAAAD